VLSRACLLGVACIKHLPLSEHSRAHTCSIGCTQYETEGPTASGLHRLACGLLLSVMGDTQTHLVVEFYQSVKEGNHDLVAYVSFPERLVVQVAAQVTLARILHDNMELGAIIHCSPKGHDMLGIQQLVQLQLLHDLHQAVQGILSGALQA